MVQCVDVTRICAKAKSQSVSLLTRLRGCDKIFSDAVQHYFLTTYTTILTAACWVQPSWWHEHEEGVHSSSSSPHRELPVSSGIPNGNGTPRSDTASPRHPAVHGNLSSIPADTPKAHHSHQATSLQQAVQDMHMTGAWVNPMQSDAKHPPPRYEHAANLVGHSLYIIGGNCGKLAAAAIAAAADADADAAAVPTHLHAACAAPAG